MVFFLTMEEDHAQQALAVCELRQAAGDCGRALQPHVARLEAALSQDPVEGHPRAAQPESVKPLVGWCRGAHSLLQKFE